MRWAALLLAVVLGLSGSLAFVGSPPVAFTVRIDTKSAEVREQVAVHLKVVDISGDPGVGAWRVDVTYDPDVISLVACTPTNNSSCNREYAENALQVIGASAVGYVEDFTIASIAFECEAIGTSPLALAYAPADATIATTGAGEGVTIEHGAVVCRAAPSQQHLLPLARSRCRIQVQAAVQLTTHRPGCSPRWRVWQPQPSSPRGASVFAEHAAVLAGHARHEPPRYHARVMATRLTYALPIAKQLALSTARRLRPGGLAAGVAARTPPQDRAEALSLRVPERPFFIVTGAGRSGTSAVARVLHESGVRMGDELGQASEINPDGFYEDMGVWWLHERLYAELGMATMWRLERWPWRSTVLAVAAKYRAEMAALYAKARDGWKDPRFALTLEAWLPVLPVRPKVIVCLRSPHAYVDSVTRVFGLVDPRALERQWAGRYRRLLDVIRDERLEATCVEYNALVERPEETVAALARFAGRPLRPEFVDAGRRQFSRPVPERYVRLYREVLALAGDDAPDLASPAPHEQREAPDDEEAIAAYRDATSAIERAVEDATPAWAARRAEADGASEAYSAVLKDAQERLGALDPPRRLARYHDLLERDVNLLRMTAELFVAAAKDGGADRRMGRSALRAERAYASPRALAASREERARERAAASGHAAPSLGQRV